jgi:hypothetical protein
MPREEGDGRPTVFLTESSISPNASGKKVI